MITNNKCSVCGEQIKFKGQRGPKKTLCSEKCRSVRDWLIKKKRLPNKVIHCQFCSSEMVISGSNNSRKYCSNKCRISHESDRLKNLRLQKPKIIKVYPFCKCCGKEFRPRLKKYSSFCSRECYFIHKGFRKSCIKVKSRLEELEKCCRICGKPSGKTLCSRECQLKDAREKSRILEIKKHKTIKVKCKNCLMWFEKKYGTKKRSFCSAKCSKSYSNKISKPKYTKRLAGKFILFVDKNEIAKRDNWKCGICRLPINPKLKFPNLKSFTLDHIVPLARGGLHEPKNVQAAHFICNSKKRDLETPDQLRMY